MSEENNIDPIDSIFADIQRYEEQNKINSIDNEHFIRYNSC